MPVGDRYGDWEERMEWQANQIRQAVFLIAAIMALGVVLGFVIGAAA